jgi:hypothetical protein
VFTVGNKRENLVVPSQVILISFDFDETDILSVMISSALPYNFRFISDIKVNYVYLCSFETLM